MWTWIVAAALGMDATHAKLQEVLRARVARGRVDYAGLKAAPQALDAYLAQVAGASLDAMTAPEKMAFLINAYNALTLDLIADEWPLTSIRDLNFGQVWSFRRFRVAGADRSLDDLEHKLLRPMGDPRIHAAVNCASIGCPPLSDTVFTAAGLDGQLDAASRRWAATSTLAGGTLTVSKIFDWYGDDFVVRYGASRWDIPGLSGKEEAAANFVAAHVPALADAIKRGGYTVAYAPYDWGVNAR